MPTSIVRSSAILHLNDKYFSIIPAEVSPFFRIDFRNRRASVAVIQHYNTLTVIEWMTNRRTAHSICHFQSCMPVTNRTMARAEQTYSLKEKCSFMRRSSQADVTIQCTTCRFFYPNTHPSISWAVVNPRFCHPQSCWVRLGWFATPLTATLLLLT